MPTEHQNLLLASLSGGMDYDSRPYTIAQSHWRTVFNFRQNGGLVQVPRKKITGDLNIVDTVTAVTALPSDSHAMWLASTANWLFGFFYNGLGLTKMVLGSLSGQVDRMAMYHYNGAVWMTSPSNQVFYTDGTTKRLVTDRRQAFLKPSGEDLTGDGPFTLDPLYDVNGDIIGDLGPSFTWTVGQYYRVYVTNPRAFKREWAVHLALVNPDPETVPLEGEVVAVMKDYLVIRATLEYPAVANLNTSPIRMITVSRSDVPSGRYISVFFDHLVIGAPTYRGQLEKTKVRWSHLKDFAEWDPDTSNEADTYTFTEFQRSTDLVEGVTGIQQFGDMLLIFTYSCVFAMQYVGLPPVMRVTPLVKDHGNGLYYATAALDNAVVWCDVGHADFMLYRGQGAESIGHGIRDWFFNDLNPDPQYAQQTWAYVDPYWHEVVWVYISSTATTHNRAVAFNYKYKTWSARSVEGLLCFGTLFRSTTPVGGLSGTCASLTGTAGALGKQATYLGNVWGVAGGLLLGEAASGTVVGDLLSSEQAYLETGDFLYGTLEDVKEVDQMTLSSSQPMTVKVSARPTIESTVSFTTVGTWSLTMQTGNTLPFSGGGLPGRVFRYRVEPTIANQWCTFNLMEPDALNVGAAR